MYNSLRSGGVAEWSKAAVLKTVECNSSQGSNPCPTAIPSFVIRQTPFQISFLIKWLSNFYSYVNRVDFA